MKVFKMTVTYFASAEDRLIASFLHRDRKVLHFLLKMKVLGLFQTMYIAKGYIFMLFGGCSISF